MADFDSSLPIRTEAAGDVVVKVADATVPAQQLAVNGDGSVNITDNGGSLTVDAIDLDIRDLDSASDSVEVLQAAHDNLNANANIQVGNVDVANGNPVPVSDAGGSLTVDATDFDIRDLDSAQDSVEVFQAAHDNLNANANIQVANADVSVSNPVPVTVVDSVPGTSVNSYNTATVASGATSNHDYTVTAATTLQLSQVFASASGRLKVEVQIETGVATGVFNTRFVGFNSTATPNIEVPIGENIPVAAGVRVRVIRTNADNQSQDVYSTISGHEVA